MIIKNGVKTADCNAPEDARNSESPVFFAPVSHRMDAANKMISPIIGVPNKETIRSVKRSSSGDLFDGH